MKSCRSRRSPSFGASLALIRWPESGPSEAGSSEPWPGATRGVGEGVELAAVVADLAVAVDLGVKKPGPRSRNWLTGPAAG
jgi:hypothetical protein